MRTGGSSLGRTKRRAMRSVVVHRGATPNWKPSNDRSTARSIAAVAQQLENGGKGVAMRTMRTPDVGLAPRDSRAHGLALPLPLPAPSSLDRLLKQVRRPRWASAAAPPPPACRPTCADARSLAESNAVFRFAQRRLQHILTRSRSRSPLAPSLRRALLGMASKKASEAPASDLLGAGPALLTEEVAVFGGSAAAVGAIPLCTPSGVFVRKGARDRALRQRARDPPPGPFVSPHAQTCSSPSRASRSRATRSSLR